MSLSSQLPPHKNQSRPSADNLPIASKASSTPANMTGLPYMGSDRHPGTSASSLDEEGPAAEKITTPNQGSRSQSLPGGQQRRRALLRHAIRVLLPPAAFLILVVALCHALHTFEYLSFPPFCRLPGMEVYTHTGHCRPSSLPEIVDPDIDPSILLLDGPPPEPLYWAEFEGLGELQRRMAEHIFNASVYPNSTLLEFLSVELNKESSALKRLKRDAAQKNYKTGRAVREILYTGSQLGTRLVELQEDASVAVGSFIHSNEQVAAGIELAIEQQPNTVPAQIIASMLPRPREFIWMWKPEMEVKWQFYSSLTSFSWDLYGSLLEFDKLRRRIAKYGEMMGKVRVFLVDSEREEGDVSSPPVKSDRTSLFSWWAMITWARAKKEPPPSKKDEKERDPFKKAIQDCLDRLAEDTQAASHRVERAVAGLRILSQELEEMRHRIARPVAPIPLYVHLRHVYVAGERLGKIREKVQAAAETHEQEKRNRAGP